MHFLFIFIYWLERWGPPNPGTSTFGWDKTRVFPARVLRLVPPAEWTEKLLLPNSDPLLSLERGNLTNFLAVLPFESPQPWCLLFVVIKTYRPPAARNRLALQSRLATPLMNPFKHVAGTIIKPFIFPLHYRNSSDYKFTPTASHPTPSHTDWR